MPLIASGISHHLTDVDLMRKLIKENERIHEQSRIYEANGTEKLVGMGAAQPIHGD